MKISHLFLAVAAVVTCTAVACGGNGVPEDALTPQEFEIRVPEQDSLNCLHQPIDSSGFAELSIGW